MDSGSTLKAALVLSPHQPRNLSVWPKGHFSCDLPEIRKWGTCPPQNDLPKCGGGVFDFHLVKTPEKYIKNIFPVVIDSL